MIDYVQYHHPDNAPIHRTTPFFIHTAKPVGDCLGSRIWVVTATAKPRQYFLVEWFIADEINGRETSHGVNVISGQKGEHFGLSVRIDQEPWFKNFLRSQGNFRFGFSQISDLNSIEGLECSAGLRERLPVSRQRQGRSGDLPSGTTTEEVDENEISHLPEGAVRKIVVNAYERNKEARCQCIDHYTARCAVCNLAFEDRYGVEAKGWIHVHHLRPLAEIGREYQIDPITDLRPVCPNCHFVIHRRNPPYTIEEVQTMIAAQG